MFLLLFLLLFSTNNLFSAAAADDFEKIHASILKAMEKLPIGVKENIKARDENHPKKPFATLMTEEIIRLRIHPSKYPEFLEGNARIAATADNDQPEVNGHGSIQIAPYGHGSRARLHRNRILNIARTTDGAHDSSLRGAKMRAKAREVLAKRQEATAAAEEAAPALDAAALVAAEVAAKKAADQLIAEEKNKATSKKTGTKGKSKK